ncbi:MAG TPA: methylated-DNA--[protein]-cysteine S-methyltransferase [Bacillota bacterium]|nr:methylated-DNA--[protein]-cysteine S-methyltransferase [Bacillota bacterium]
MNPNHQLDKIWYNNYTSPLGELKIASSPTGVCRLSLPSESWEDFITALRKQYPESRLDRGLGENSKVIQELKEYFSGRRQQFTCDLDLQGTEFQLQVWEALRKIPFGTTCSYEDIARAVGREKGSRAVGQANGLNPVSIIIPCHRVVTKDGKLGGYGGGPELKRYLLTLESMTK